MKTTRYVFVDNTDLSGSCIVSTLKHVSELSNIKYNTIKKYFSDHTVYCDRLGKFTIIKCELIKSKAR